MATQATVKDVPADKFIAQLAAHLKKKMDVPQWADLVKTAPHKEMCPQDPDWFFIRAASLARRIYIRGGNGVGAFTKIYGGRASHGVRNADFGRAARGCIRHALTQLKKLKIIDEKKDKKGRFITNSGQKLLDQVAAQCLPKGKGNGFGLAFGDSTL